MATDIWIGRELAGYRIERVVGRGGMGVVYLAEDARLGRRVALKLLSPELAEDPQFRDRFVRESRLAASLEHPNIVPIHAAGESDGVLYLAMRFIEGTDLRALVGEHQGIGLERTSRIVSQVASALDAAHSQGLVHRDVKPGNVLIADVGGADHCYLSDFGLTKQASSMSGLTGTGQLVGTVDYLAPEAIEGKPVDGRSDQYALGCVLYESLTGRPPFRRLSDAATLWAHIRDQPAPLADAIPGLAPVDPVVRRAVQKNPAGRYASCGDLARDLRRAVPGQPGEPGGVRRRVKVAAAAVFAVAVLVTAIVTTLLTGSAASAHFKPAPPDSVVMIDPANGKIVGSPIRVGRAPTQIVASGNNIWVANSAGRSVSWINGRTRSLVRTIPLHATPTGVARAPHGGLWVNEGLARSIQEILPQPDGTYDNPITVHNPGCCRGPGTIAASRSMVWIGDAEGIRGLNVSNPAAPRWEPKIYGRPAAGGVAMSPDGAGYFTDGWDHIIPVLTGGVAAPLSNPVPGEPSGLTLDGPNLWFLLPGDDQLVRWAPTEGAYGDLKTAGVAGEPLALARWKNSVWVSQGSGVITQIDAVTLRARRSVRVGDRPVAATGSDGVIWIALQSRSAPADASGSIAYHNTRSNNVDVRSADGATAAKVLLNVQWPGMPDWSPDGRRVVYISPSAGGGPQATYVADADGSHHLELTRPRWGPGEFGPSWSPDNRWIAVWRDIRDRLPTGVHARNDLVLMHPNGSQAHTILSLKHPFLILAQLDWSPDGRHLVVEEPAGQGSDGPLAIVSPEGNGIRKLTVYPVWSARWSPDGTRIAYISSSDGLGVYVTGVDGLGTRKLTSIQNASYGSAGTVAWSPDGREVAYAGYNNQNAGEDSVHVMNSDGTGDRIVAPNAEFPAWRPYN